MKDEGKILEKNKPIIKSVYDVSKNSIKLSLPKTTKMQRHKYYLRSIGYEEIGKNYYNEMQYEDFFMINYTLHGSAKLKYDNIEFTLRPGDLCFLYTYQRRIFRPVSDKDYDWIIYYIHFFGEDVKDFFNGLKNDELIIVHDFPREQIEPYVKRMLNGIKSTPPAPGKQIVAKYLQDFAQHSGPYREGERGRKTAAAAKHHRLYRGELFRADHAGRHRETLVFFEIAPQYAVS